MFLSNDRGSAQGLCGTEMGSNRCWKVFIIRDLVFREGQNVRFAADDLVACSAVELRVGKA